MGTVTQNQQVADTAGVYLYYSRPASFAPSLLQGGYMLVSATKHARVGSYAQHWGRARIYDVVATVANLRQNGLATYSFS